MYKEYEKIIQEKINKKEEEIEELSRQIDTIENDKSFIKTKRKEEFKNLFIEKIESEKKNLYKEIRELKVLLNSPKNIFNANFELDDIDVKYLKDKEYSNSKMEIKTIEDLALVHKTKFLPINGVIYTPRETKALVKEEIIIDGKEYEYEHEVGNNTVHFAVNGPVSDHFEGTWSGCQYAVIIPFDKVNKDNLICMSEEDTWFENKVKLPEGSFIICPKEEKELARKRNPHETIICCDSSKIGLDDAIRCVLMYNGYKNKRIDTHSWFNDHLNKIALEDNENFLKIKRDNNIIDKDGNHADSINLVRRQLYTLSKEVIALNKMLIDNNLLNIDIDKLEFSSIEHVTDDLLKEFIVQFKEDLLKSKLHVIDSLIDEDLMFLYELVVKTKHDEGTGEYINCDVTKFIPIYLTNILITYEEINRKAYESILEERIEKANTI